MKEENISALTNILTSYTAQLEEYERACGTFTFSILSAIAAVITIAVTVCSSSLVIDTYVIIAACLLIPGLELLFLFVFSHYTRRIAFYRGYCVNIENKLNELSESNEFFFHRVVKDETMSVFGKSECFMYIGFFIPFAVCLLLGLHIIAKSFGGCALKLFIFFYVLFFLAVGVMILEYIKVLRLNRETADRMISFNIFDKTEKQNVCKK